MRVRGLSIFALPVRLEDGTDWREIVGLCDALARVDSSPVVALNRTVAVAMRDGPAAGLAAVDQAMADPNAGRLPPGLLGSGRPVPPIGQIGRGA